MGGFLALALQGRDMHLNGVCDLPGRLQRNVPGSRFDEHLDPTKPDETSDLHHYRFPEDAVLPLQS